jgi:hypothetical protein
MSHTENYFDRQLVDYVYGAEIRPLIRTAPQRSRHHCR